MMVAGLQVLYRKYGQVYIFILDVNASRDVCLCTYRVCYSFDVDI